jgi:hypothetical protein
MAKRTKRASRSSTGKKRPRVKDLGAKKDPPGGQWSTNVAGSNTIGGSLSR